MKNNRPKENLNLGSNVIEKIIPVRRPLLMVDRIRHFEDGVVPRLLASRYISANEDVFSGHFPDLHIWPGIFTQEGLGQSSQILSSIYKMRLGWKKAGGDAEDVLQELRNLELGYTLNPGYCPEGSKTLLQIMKDHPPQLGLSVAVDLKFLRPVFGGCQLDYDVTLEKTFESMLRFRVEASVGGQPVAKGTMTGAFERSRLFEDKAGELSVDD